jgi:hypothetical protein
MQAVMRVALAAVLLSMAGAAAAAAKKGKSSTVGVSVEAGTMGLGLSVGMPLGERFNLRGVYHTYDYELDEVEDEESGATYDGELNLQSAGIMADWHPFKGAFRVTLGFLSNGNEIGLDARPTGGEYELGNCTFESNPADPLRVDGTVEFASSAPYVGIGWGGNMNSRPGFFATFDIGVMLSGSPDTRLDGRGQARNNDFATATECGSPLAGYRDVSQDPEFQQALREAEDDVNDETKDYEYWPNLSLGLGWRF